MRARRVGLVQRGLAGRVKADDERGDAEGAHAAALRVLLLYARNPLGQVLHLHAPRNGTVKPQLPVRADLTRKLIVTETLELRLSVQMHDSRCGAATDQKEKFGMT